jgi:hypothetical protein
MRKQVAMVTVALGVGATALAAQQAWRTITSARQLSGERQVSVNIEYGAGRLNVQPGAAGGDLLYRMELRYDERHMQPVAEYNRQTGALRLGIRGSERSNRARNLGEGRAQIALAPAVPTNLRVAFGAGEADVNLGGMSLTDVHITTGAAEARVSFDRPNRVAARRVRLESGAAELTVTGLANARADLIEFEGGVGETTLDFGGTWARSTRANVKVGIGSLTLRLPRGLGVRLHKESFLTSFETDGFTRRGDYWYSPQYERARVRLDLNVDAAIGTVDVDWIS